MRLTLGGARTTASNLKALPTLTDSNIRKSRSGYLFTLGRGPTSYKSKQQTCVAQSTCEAEYYYAAIATKEGLHLRQLMGEILNAPITEITTIWEDNQSAIAYSQNALVSEKTKHIGVKWHFLKDHVEQGTIKFKYLPTNQMLAYMFTKSLQGHALTRHRSAIMRGADLMQRFIP
jgi:hypothetical protein